MNQFFSPLAEPIGAIWGLMVLGVLWLLGRRQWRSAIWLGIPSVLLFVIGSTPLAKVLVANEERQWVEGVVVGKAASRNQKLEIANQKSETIYDVVVALGGGERVSQNDLLGFAVSDGGSRILTAIQLVRSGKAKKLVLGGSLSMPGPQGAPSMSVVQDWVKDWGLVGGGLTNLGVCNNTHDEAIAFRKLAQSQGWSKVMLVTSALHLRRAVALLKKQGMEVTPVAADFQVLGVPQVSFSPFPRQHRFCLLALYLHEKIGWWVYDARGWV